MGIIETKNLGDNIKELVLVGSGGCMREVAYQFFDYEFYYKNILRQVFPYLIKGYIDINDYGIQNVSNNQIPYIGNDNNLTNYDSILLTIGDVKARRKFINKDDIIKENIKKFVFRDCKISNLNDIGDGTIICANSFISTNVEISKFCFINVFSYIAHDCILGENVVVSPRVTICGNVTIGNDTFIGAGAIIKQGINVGSNVIIGAGAVVVSDVKDKEIVVGVPAKPI